MLIKIPLVFLLAVISDRDEFISIRILRPDQFLDGREYRLFGK